MVVVVAAAVLAAVAAVLAAVVAAVVARVGVMVVVVALLWRRRRRRCCCCCCCAGPVFAVAAMAAGKTRCRHYHPPININTVRIMFVVVTEVLVYMMHSSSESEASSLFSKQTSANQLHKLYRPDAARGNFCQKCETAWDPGGHHHCPESIESMVSLAVI